MAANAEKRLAATTGATAQREEKAHDVEQMIVRERGWSQVDA